MAPSGYPVYKDGRKNWNTWVYYHFYHYTVHENIQNKWIQKLNKKIKVLEIFTFKTFSELKISFHFNIFEHHQTRNKRK